MMNKLRDQPDQSAHGAKKNHRDDESLNKQFCFSTHAHLMPKQMPNGQGKRLVV
jgi:hypothetical protein